MPTRNKPRSRRPARSPGSSDTTQPEALCTCGRKLNHDARQRATCSGCGRPPARCSCAPLEEASFTPTGKMMQVLVVIEGETATMPALPNFGLWIVMGSALKVSGIAELKVSGSSDRPLEDWAAQDADGNELDQAKSLDALGIKDGARVWLSLRSGRTLEPAFYWCLTCDKPGTGEHTSAGHTVVKRPTLHLCQGCTFGTIEDGHAAEHQASTGHAMRRALVKGGAPLAPAEALARLAAERERARGEESPAAPAVDEDEERCECGRVLEYVSGFGVACQGCGDPPEFCKCEPLWLSERAAAEQERARAEEGEPLGLSERAAGDGSATNSAPAAGVRESDPNTLLTEALYALERMRGVTAPELFACNVCSFETTDQAVADQHREGGHSVSRFEAKRAEEVMTPDQAARLDALGFLFVGVRDGELVARLMRWEVFSRTPAGLLAEAERTAEAVEEAIAERSLESAAELPEESDAAAALEELRHEQARTRNELAGTRTTLAKLEAVTGRSSRVMVDEGWPALPVSTKLHSAADRATLTAALLVAVSQDLREVKLERAPRLGSALGRIGERMRQDGMTVRALAELAELPPGEVPPHLAELAASLAAVAPEPMPAAAPDEGTGREGPAHFPVPPLHPLASVLAGAVAEARALVRLVDKALELAGEDERAKATGLATPLEQARATLAWDVDLFELLCRFTQIIHAATDVKQGKAQAAAELGDRMMAHLSTGYELAHGQQPASETVAAASALVGEVPGWTLDGWNPDLEEWEASQEWEGGALVLRAPTPDQLARACLDFNRLALRMEGTP